MNKSRFSLSTVAVMAAFSSISAAQAAPVADAAQAPNESWYVGISAGRSDSSFTSSDYTPANGQISESQDKTKTSGKGFIGYDFNKNWAVELGYTSFGEPRYKYDGTGASAGGAAHDKVRETAWSLVAKGSLPINEQFGLFAKLGATRNRSQGSYNIDSSNAAFAAIMGTTSTSASTSRSDVLIGVGAQFYFNKNVAIRLEYEDYGRFGNSGNFTTAAAGSYTGRTKVNIWTGGISYNF